MPAGALVLVATPIGNLGDLPPRAAEALASADVVACEDTRRTGRLLQHAGIRAPRLVRMDEHTEGSVAAGLVEQVLRGRTVVVVTDAGTPGLSDPGAVLVRAAIAAGATVRVVPGPFAGAAAAVVSGLLDPSGRHRFEGFLPRKGPTRRERLAMVAASDVPVVLYEAPHRVEATLADLAAACGGDRGVALCRELTKLHEELWHGDLEGAVDHLAERGAKGEYVLVVGAAPPPADPDDETIVAAAQDLLAGGMSRRDVAVELSASFGVAPNRVKRLLAAWTSPDDTP